jgi:nickel-dependent lactate racemase
MSETSTPVLHGFGSSDADLTSNELREIVDRALNDVRPGSRVLAIIPDKTRDDITDRLLPFAADALAARGAARLDALVAQGTHAPMTDEEKRAKIGGDAGRLPLPCRIFDHRWDDPDALVTLGALPASLVREASEGVLDEEIPLRLNRLLAPGVYDTVVIVGATTPHEVAGFSGGAKYLFPGVAGPDLTHKTHWLGALVSVERVIGQIETPTRRLIEAAATCVQAPVVSFNAVVTRTDDGRIRTHALFAGDVREAFRSAARVSARVHVRYTGRRYRRVVALLDEHLDDMWVGGKASYRLGAIIEEGGELIVYAPHLDRISTTHGRMIEQYGYAPLEVVREQVARSPELRENLCVAAHLAHVAYASRRDERGRIVPRYRITLATGIDRETCERVNLGFADHRAFDRARYDSYPDTLVVERAGCDLYLVAPDASANAR